DDMAGGSSFGARIAYRPAIQTVSPMGGSTEGDAQVVLFGQGLAPPINSDPTMPPDFSKVAIDFEKGGRVLTVRVPQIHVKESSFNQLVFQVPQSPDGKPGPANIILKVDLGVIPVMDKVVDGYVYRRPNPGFGPRGALLTDMPTRVRFVDVVG